MPQPTVLNARARTTVDQVNGSHLRNTTKDEPSVHRLLLHDQPPLKVQSIRHVCAGLLQSYMMGGNVEPWKPRHVDQALVGCMGARFLFPDYLS